MVDRLVADPRRTLRRRWAAAARNVCRFASTASTDVAQYGALLKYLGRLEFIDSVQIEEVTLNVVMLSLHTRTPWDRLRDLLALDGRLVPSETIESARAPRCSRRALYVDGDPVMTSGLLRQIPNVITVARVLLVIPTAWCLVEGRYVEALVLMAVAGASDAVDGWLARRFDWVTWFGAARRSAGGQDSGRRSVHHVDRARCLAAMGGRYRDRSRRGDSRPAPPRTG